ncbi:MAG: hypothetical protein B7O98_08415 [Zestosphaera tikiterensis]|uniref:EamA domain-containing protein n=1 Tax=Zestosphaera tikiterensis TaxID=1973259 RepID=A0A2R7Y4Q1_9CREN|nr:MAG: hypothetical protein B7O98_08415 [Zestosphaera tikiterensis]
MKISEIDGVALVKPALTYLRGSVLVTSLRMLITTSLFLPLGLVVEGRFVSGKLLRDVLIASILTGFLSLSVGVLIFTQAINVAGVSASIIATAQTPILSQITTKLISKESLSRRNVLGAFVVSGGILLAML